MVMNFLVMYEEGTEPFSYQVHCDWGGDSFCFLM